MQAAFFHILETQSRDDLRCMAGKRIAAWSDEDELASPAAHACFRKFRVVIGHDKFDADFSAQALFGALEEFHRAYELLASRQQMLPVGKSPAVILHVGEFDAAGAGGFGESQHFFDLIDVAAMDDEIKRDGYAVLLEPIENAEFLRVRFCAADVVGELFARGLKT